MTSSKQNCVLPRTESSSRMPSRVHSIPHENSISTEHSACHCPTRVIHDLRSCIHQRTTSAGCGHAGIPSRWTRPESTVAASALGCSRKAGIVSISATPTNSFQISVHFVILWLQDDDNMWYCNRCKEHKKATKSMAISMLPRILVRNLPVACASASTFHFQAVCAGDPAEAISISEPYFLG